MSNRKMRTETTDRDNMITIIQWTVISNNQLVTGPEFGNASET